MSYRSVLAYVDGGEATHQALSIAAMIAREHDARLTGLHVAAPALLPGDNRIRMTAEMADALARQRTESAERAEHMFRAAAGDLPRTGWEVAQHAGGDDTPSLIGRWARCFDLTVIGQIGEGERLGRRPGMLPEQLVMQAGRPILVVPPTNTTASAGRRVLVGWDQSREAARALADALPILERAEKVWVLTIAEPEDRAAFAANGEDHRLDRAISYLADHGIEAIPLKEPTGDLNAGEILLARAADNSADLLVLGAYGHSRLRELVLGGVTRDLLTHMTVPMLLAH
jgi:nucleotide-binding universal stress UspA family protein